MIHYIKEDNHLQYNFGIINLKYSFLGSYA